ncbi:MAG: hypothetical protein MJ078_07290, partial [Clostridia bacterium]|nr:hypothetical protein [Clostridia bacterium]
MKRTGKLLSLFLAILMLLPVTAFCFLPAEAKSEAAPAPKIVSQNLSLEDNVYILFRVSYPGVDWEKDDYGMMFWFSPQKEEDYTYENALAAPLDTAVVYGKTDNRSYDEKLSLQVATYFHGVSAKEIGDTVYARAYVRGADGYVYSDVIAYSALKYAMRKLGTAPGYSPTQNDELKSLLRTMLEYGTAAQIYFHYRTDSPVSEGLYPHYRVTVENGVLPDGTASGEYKENTPLTVTPRQAGEAFAFSGWYEGDTKVSDSLSYSFTLTGNRTLSARFEKKESRGLTFTDAGQNTCLVSGTGECTDAEIFIPEKSP